MYEREELDFMGIRITKRSDLDYVTRRLFNLETVPLVFFFEFLFHYLYSDGFYNFCCTTAIAVNYNPSGNGLPGPVSVDWFIKQYKSCRVKLPLN